HDMGVDTVELTFDPGLPLYTISLTRAQGWREADVFTIEFIGPSGLVISTNRQEISADGGTLSVADTGFGNVLNGLQFNQLARARLGAQVVDISLDGAAEPVEKFRRCRAEAGV
ncbi:MAG: hypothetical protein AB3N13_12320, partial [Arenibacterium sp.]